MVVLELFFAVSTSRTIKGTTLTLSHIKITILPTKNLNKLDVCRGRTCMKEYQRVFRI